MDARTREIQAQRDALAGVPGLSDQARKDAITAIDAAMESLNQAALFAADAARFERDKTTAAAELEATKAQTAQPAEPPVQADSAATIEQLRQMRDQAEANLTQAQGRVTLLKEEAAARLARRSDIPVQIAKSQQELEQVTAGLAAIDGQATGDEPAALAQIRKSALGARQLRLSNQIAALGKELANYDARTELYQLHMEQADRKVAALDRQAKDWREIVARREKQDAARDAEAARRAVAEQQPALKAVAQSNVSLLEMLSGSPAVGPGLLAKKAAAQVQLDDLTKKAHSLEDRFARERRIGSVADLAEVIDVRLRQIRAELPDPASHRATLNARRRDFTEMQQRLADLEYERDALPDIDSAKRELMAKVDASVDPEMRETIAAQLDDLLRKQRQAYVTLVETGTDYADLLVRLQRQESSLIDVSERFASYIDERILWIRSMPRVGGRDIPDAVSSAQYLFAPMRWIGLGRSLWTDATNHAEIIGAWIIVFLLLFVIKRRLAAKLKQIAGLMPQIYDDRFMHTVQALLVTALLAVFWPAVIWFIAWRVGAQEGDEFGSVAAAGMNRAATILLTMQALRQLCKPFGLGESHFRWESATRRSLNANLAWLYIVVPLAFTIAAVEANAGDEAVSALGRLAFIAAMAAVAVFAFRVLNPSHHILDAVLKSAGDSWLYRLRHMLFAAIVCVPLALLITAALGYYYTALQLNHRLVATFWLIEGLIVFNGLVRRWLLLARRRLAMEDAKNRRAPTAQADGGGSIPTGETSVVIAEPKIDLAVINDQTRRLLRTAIALGLALGVWAVWVDMLPALRILNRIELYPHFATLIDSAAEEPVVLADGPKPVIDANAAPRGAVETALDGVETVAALPVAGEHVLTLSDVFVGLLILLITIVLAHNLPGLLEITILPQLPLDASGRFAVATIARYIVSIVGMVLVFSALGIGWTQVQWLAAAISLGIGFGLQEIFANFISGIMLLFEQPIRVGDTVTIKGNEGTVSRIRMRATTIVDYDRREIIIPNKDLITGQIMNWTLSDTTHRLVFAVGVAFGSDTARVEQILRKVATDHPLVMRTPSPQVVFLKMGESSLEFSMRAFIANLDNALEVRHDLNVAIERALREAGIEVAYPQRDLHIRSMPREHGSVMPG